MIVPVQAPLERSTLRKLNAIYQRNNIWGTTDDSYSLTSFYGHAFATLPDSVLALTPTRIILALLQKLRLHCFLLKEGVVTSHPVLTTAEEELDIQMNDDYIPEQAMYTLTQSYRIN